LRIGVLSENEIPEFRRERGDVTATSSHGGLDICRNVLLLLLPDWRGRCWDGHCGRRRSVAAKEIR
jgi:hypothetical protein